MEEYERNNVHYNRVHSSPCVKYIHQQNCKLLQQYKLSDLFQNNPVHKSEDQVLRRKNKHLLIKVTSKIFQNTI